MTLALPEPFIEDRPDIQANFEAIALAWLNRGAGIVAGGVQLYAGATAPVGYLLCNGASLLRASYPALFTAIGVAYGSVDATHFNVPDLRGRAPLGVGTATGGGVTGATAHTLGQKAGVETYTLLKAESGMPAHATLGESATHTHGVSGPNFLTWDGSTITVGSGAFAATPTASASATAANSPGHTHSVSGVDATSPHTNLQPYIGMNWLIKT